MSIVLKKMIDFTSPAVMPNGDLNDEFKLSEYTAGQYGVLFFYPLDFTFVCPTELIALSNRMSDFDERNVKVVAISVDSKFSHMAWRKVSVENGGIGSVRYPLVSDITKEISSSYGVLHESAVALRGTFIFDQKQEIKQMSVNDLSTGRNIDEVLRTIDALQYTEKHGDVCPAGWRPGKESMKATTLGVADFLASNADDL